MKQGIRSPTIRRRVTPDAIIDFPACIGKPISTNLANDPFFIW
jgi:hypothetical protein